MRVIDYVFAIYLAFLFAALLILNRIGKNAIIGEVADEEEMYLDRPMQIEYQDDRVDY
ncbi:MAG: hypothetical protein J6B19_06730 [Lachnospiraceae bacterium]|nr:hypothetical protein [Lachnospiraceae bacterium]